MQKTMAVLALALQAWSSAAADEPVPGQRPLPRNGDAARVSISGLSSGGAMALQFAMAHSAAVTGVGTVAAPAWGCAEGDVGKAVHRCMCAAGSIAPGTGWGRQAQGLLDNLVREKKIDRGIRVEYSDPLESPTGDIQPVWRSTRLRDAYVFHSPRDGTVMARAGDANASLLRAFTGRDLEPDRGSAVDRSNQALHGLLNPRYAPSVGGRDGGAREPETCLADEPQRRFIRRCGQEDNAGEILQRLLGGEGPPLPQEHQQPQGRLHSFDQTKPINEVKAAYGREAGAGSERPDSGDGSPFLGTGLPLAGDIVVGWFTFTSPRRYRFDMAKQGYFYVPPACTEGAVNCPVHVALHGCRQDALHFAQHAGYREWADRLGAIVIFPALERVKHRESQAESDACGLPYVDALQGMLNWNTCWDWWGYLDPPRLGNRYLSQEAPQMQVIQRIVEHVTGMKMPKP